MAGYHDPIRINQDRIGEAELANALLNLLDLFARVGSRIVRIMISML
jgi:hypothetical protein